MSLVEAENKMKKLVLPLLILCVAITLVACSDSGSVSNSNTESKETPSNEVPSYNTTTSSNASSSLSSLSFTNKYGTPDTICEHSGCTKKIASSGDTNCCTLHSNKCADCGSYIDEDATWCMSCLEDAIQPSSGSSSYSSNNSSNSYSSSAEEYWCMGKNDTCNNKTSSAYDFYCNSCDPDGDGEEG